MKTSIEVSEDCSDPEKWVFPCLLQLIPEGDGEGTRVVLADTMDTDTTFSGVLVVDTRANRHGGYSTGWLARRFKLLERGQRIVLEND